MKISKNDGIEAILLEIITKARSNSFAGYDPFDGLNSTYLKPLFRLSKYIRLAFLQFNKLSPINFRPIFGIQTGVNPKGLALFLSGSCLSGSQDLENFADDLFEKLILAGIEKEGSIGWGYNFDWQNRVFYIPKNTPTVVNTAFAAHAIMDYYELRKDKSVCSYFPKLAKFFLNQLNRTITDDTICFSYTPIDNTQVHNANLLAAGALARLYGYLNQSDIADIVEKATKFSLNAQTSDGAWIYGSHRSQAWVDSFHTGFNLEALSHVLHSGIYSDISQLSSAINRGEDYYVQNFFGPNGEPYYYNNKNFPYDIHTPAQAISYLCKNTKYIHLVEKVIQWTFKHMYSQHFYYRIGITHTNKISYIRWGEAWMFYGLAKFIGNRHL